MYRLLIILLPFLSVIACNSSYAGISAIDAHGLSDKYITSIAKDQQGLMWIGTHQGLYTFDGYEFEPVNAQLVKSASIVKLIYNTANDVLWIATETGVCTMSCRTHAIGQAGTEVRWQSGVTGMFSGVSGRIYISFKNGVLGVSDLANHLKYLTTLNGIDPELKGIKENIARNETVLFTQTQTALSEVTVANNTTVKSVVELNFPGIVVINKEAFILDTENGFQLIDVTSKKDITPVHLFAMRQKLISITNIYNDGKYTYILCRPSFLYRVDTITKTVERITSEAFTGRLSTCMYFDDDGLIWIGTNKGLLKNVPDKEIFEPMLTTTPTISVRPMMRDEYGNTYAGTYSGIFKLKNDDPTWKKITETVIYTCVNTNSDYIYFAGDIAELLRINKKTGLIEYNFYSPTASVSNNLRHTYSLVVDEQGMIWLGGNYGLKQYNPTLRRISSRIPIQWTDSTTTIRCLGLAGKDKLWLCTNKGLYLISKEGSIIWRANTQTNPALSFDIINTIVEVSDGSLWVCTAGGGVDVISQDRKSISILKTEQGLSDNVAYNLVWDRRGRAWISTYNGLSSYDTGRKTFVNYYTTDGLTSNEFNHNACLNTEEGKLYLGTINGINAFWPDSVSTTIKPSQLFAATITKWDSHSGNTIFISPSDTTRAITLNPLDHSLTFSLSIKDYTHPETNVYQYRIKGLFNEWTSLKSQHLLRLDGLAPGSYQLEVKAIDSRGVPCENVLHYRINVVQAFYKAWWFYLLILLLASALIWVFFDLRLRHIRRMQKMREQIASDLHDEVGSLLTRITLTSDKMLYSDGKTTSGLQKIAALSRTAVSSMSDVLWSIDARNDYTENLADRMREHSKEMLGQTEANIHIDIQVASKMSLSLGVRQQLYFIFKEAINNIVKHSNPTNVTIRYHHNESGFELLIENDGCHITHGSSRGQGLKNIAMRAKRIKATADVSLQGEQFHIFIKRK